MSIGSDQFPAKPNTTYTRMGGAVSARSGQFLERRQTGLSGNAVEPLLAAHAAKVAIVLLALKIDEDDE